MGIFSLVLAQTSRTSKARRLNVASSGRGSALAGCAAAGEIPMLGGDASTAALTAMPAPPSSERRETAVVGKTFDDKSDSVEMVRWSAMEILPRRHRS